MALAAVPVTYASSPELTLAIDLFRKSLPENVMLSFVRGADDLAQRLGAAITHALTGDADYLLLARDAALLLAANTVPTLAQTLDEHPELDAVLPSDPRDHGGGDVPYTTLQGFERFVATTIAGAAHLAGYDGRTPWLCLVRRNALRGRVIPAAPLDVVREIGDRAALVPRAYVHPFADYYTRGREECVPLVPDGVASVLDVGCGSGDFGAALKAARGCRVVGIERNSMIADEARARLDGVVVGDALEVDVPGSFDCVTLLDSLEHFAEPERLLERIASEFLAPGGALVLSVPNVSHWSVIEGLLAGRWDYVPAGILCNTHLRFFTASSLQRLLADAGFEVVSTAPLRIAIPERFEAGLQALRGRLDVDVQSVEAAGYHIVARVRDPQPRVARSARGRTDGADDVRLEISRQRAAFLENESERLSSELVATLERLRDESAHVRSLTAERDRLLKKQSSPGWRTYWLRLWSSRR